MPGNRRIGFEKYFAEKNSVIPFSPAIKLLHHLEEEGIVTPRPGLIPHDGGRTDGCRSTKMKIDAIISSSRLRSTVVRPIRSWSSVGKSVKPVRFGNAESSLRLFKKIEVKHPKAKKIHAILDNASHCISKRLKEKLKGSKIELHYLPGYSAIFVERQKFHLG